MKNQLLTPTTVCADWAMGACAYKQIANLGIFRSGWQKLFQSYFYAYPGVRVIVTFRRRTFVELVVVEKRVDIVEQSTRTDKNNSTFFQSVCNKNKRKKKFSSPWFIVRKTRGRCHVSLSLSLSLSLLSLSNHAFKIKSISSYRPIETNSISITSPRLPLFFLCIIQCDRNRYRGQKK